MTAGELKEVVGFFVFCFFGAWTYSVFHIYHRALDNTAQFLELPLLGLFF